MHDYCTRRALPERGVCFAHAVPFRCELKTCDDWASKPYTTCYKHSRMLRATGNEPTKLMTNDYRMERSLTLTENRVPLPTPKFRFSASSASRYNNCHGSANLPAAIPGFEFPERNESGMKGEGTRLHKIFEESVSLDTSLMRDRATLLRDVAAVWGGKRQAYLKDEVKFVTTWFLVHKTPPPLEPSFLEEQLYYMRPIKDQGIETGEEEQAGIAPRRITFLAEALEYVADLIDALDEDTLELQTEVTKQALWLKTKPNTTVDLILKDEHEMHVIDLKMGDIEVTPIENEQLMYYAVTFGAAEYDHATLHILQRKYTDNWRADKKVLEDFQERMQNSEREILDGDIRLTPGDHCTFCPANPHGRGDRGSKACPAMLSLLYGERDSVQSDADALAYEDE